ncbi:hypothetical protein Tco_1198681 [Tanacetum coccineum]
MGFKPQKEYRLVPKKPTYSSSGNKKKGLVPSIEVSNSNPFKVLNSVDNDVELGTNEGTTNLVNNEATSSGSSFMNIDNSSTRTTPIIDKTRKFKEILTSRKYTLVDEASNPVKKWERCNAIVLGWIFVSLSRDLYLGQVYSEIASEVWDELEETYDKIDGEFDLLTLLCACTRPTHEGFVGNTKSVGHFQVVTGLSS